MADGIQRIVLLNWLVSRSSTRAQHDEPPTEPASQLFGILAARQAKGWAIEFVHGPDEPDDAKRLKLGVGCSFTRISDLRIEKTATHQYVCLLIKFTDMSIKGFAVEDTVDFTGREIAGNDTERGVTAVHLVARLPLDESQFEDARYRCVIESNTPLTRAHVEHFLCRQIRRHTDAEDRSFTVVRQKGRGKPTSKSLRYTPRLELHSDVGRSLASDAPGARELSQMVFTKRAERHSVGKEVEVKQRDYFANVEIKISGRQAPVDPEERKTWMQSIVSKYVDQGFESRMYFRHLNGGVMGGPVHQDIAGATDLLMCPREYVTLTEPHKVWEPNVNGEVITAMRGILDDDDLWERRK